MKKFMLILALAAIVSSPLFMSQAEAAQGHGHKKHQKAHMHGQHKKGKHHKHV
jgi:Ni/Co efflux regulator RcnB